MHIHLNTRAWQLVEAQLPHADVLRVHVSELPGGARLIDAGIEAEGGLAAGLLLARVCMADLAEVAIVPGSLDGFGWPAVQVATDHPVEACLLSQYAGWQIAAEKYFAMGSGPMRAAAAREELFEKLQYRESAQCVVGVLETSKLPRAEVVGQLAEKCGVAAEHVTLLAAPTASQAGNLQVVARSVETAMHKLLELGFDVRQIVSAVGTAPLPPPAANDLEGIGRTNDAILYGGCVTFLVRTADSQVAQFGPQVPASSSAMHGKPFLSVFEDAGRDFYKIDPLLFSPAQVVFQNLETGRVHRYGEPSVEVLRASFGL